MHQAERRAARRLLAVVLGAAPMLARAHAGPHDAPALPWQFEPWVIVLLAAAVLAYGLGLQRLWRHAGRRAGVSLATAACFVAGWALLALALCSPLDALAANLFAAHMVQHEILMVAAAPLLVLGRPLATWAWALPVPTRTRLPEVLHGRALQRAWRAVSAPFGAFLIHMVAIWAWHLPALFAAALQHEAVHVLQHFSFLFSALLFWWSIVAAGGLQRRGGATVLYLFATMMHTGALGALLTLSNTTWYPSDPAAVATWGLSPLQDQQIGGLVMWIPAGTVYVVAALWVMARWIALSGAPSARSADPVRNG